jgi:hypothetical protein
MWSSETYPVLGMLARFTIAPITAAAKAKYITIAGVAFNYTASASSSSASDAKLASTPTVSSANFSAPIDMLNFLVVF